MVVVVVEIVVAGAVVVVVVVVSSRRRHTCILHNEAPIPKPQVRTDEVGHSRLGHVGTNHG